MNRQTFVKKLAERSGKSVGETNEFMFELEALIKDTILERDSFYFSGLFKVQPMIVKGRKYRIRGGEYDVKSRLGIKIVLFPKFRERLKEQKIVES